MCWRSQSAGWGLAGWLAGWRAGGLRGAAGSQGGGGVRSTGCAAAVSRDSAANKLLSRSAADGAAFDEMLISPLGLNRALWDESGAG